jgi:ribonucleoside-diphosphate reductase alpha subunit
MYVVKRNKNKSIRKEPVHFDKITRRIQKLLYGGLDKTIDPVIITQKICSRIFSGITTTELDNLAAQICMSLVTEHYNYGILGSRIAISNHQKNTSDNFLEVVDDLSNNRDVHDELAPLLSDEFVEIVRIHHERIEEMIDYERDYLLDYFGYRTLEKSYLLRVNVDKGKSQRIIERPQHLFMRVAIGLHGTDFERVKKTYDGMSLKKFTMATPTLFNASSKYPQLSSCFLTATHDSIEGIFQTVMDCAKISKFAGGIGVHISNIRSNGAYIRKTGGRADGIMPMLKVYNDVARYINQGGRRAGSFAMYLEPHHPDIFEFLEAKKPTGAEEKRARDLFYALWIPDLFMEKIKNNDDWYLLDPDACQGLQDVYGKEYNTLYNKYVNEKKYTKKIKAREIWEAVIASQIETGTPYILYKDACNIKSNQKNIDTIRSSNLCAEILEVSNQTETAVCNLASICLASILESPNQNDIQQHMSWRKLLSPEQKNLVKYYFDGKLKLYSTNDCIYCKLLKGLLKSLNLDYEEISEEQAEKYRIMSNPSLSVTKPFETVPQLFGILNNNDIQHLGGYTDSWTILSPKINYKKLVDLAYDVVINLNSVIDKNYYPIEKCKTSNMRHRPVGLGVNGLADVFMMLKIPFDSEEARKINKEIFESMYYGAIKSSHDLAIKEGPYSTFQGSPLSEGLFQFNLWGLKDEQLSGKYDWNSMRDKVMKNGVRNSLLVALMPTASSASIYGYNEAFEAITSNLYNRRTLGGEFLMVNKYLTKDLIDLDLWNDRTRDRLMYDKGSVQKLSGLPKMLKDIYKTVYEISQKSIIEMSADRAPFVCQSQSMNLFFDKVDFKTLNAAHFLGWKLGLKTGSYYIRTKASTNAQNFAITATREKEMMLEDQKIEEENGCLSCGA